MTYDLTLTVEAGSDGDASRYLLSLCEHAQVAEIPVLETEITLRSSAEKKKSYTVLALYEDNHQRYATSVEAEGVIEAERIAREEASGELLIAGVIEGEHEADLFGYAIGDEPEYREGR